MKLSKIILVLAVLIITAAGCNENISDVAVLKVFTITGITETRVDIDDCGYYYQYGYSTVEGITVVSHDLLLYLEGHTYKGRFYKRPHNNKPVYALREIIREVPRETR